MMLTPSKKNRKIVGKEIFKVGLPIIIQGMLFSLVPLIDNLYVGRLQNAEYVTAGLNAANQLIFVISTIVTGFIGGVGVYLAQSNGKKSDKDVWKFFYIKLLYAVFFGAILITFAMLFTKTFAQFWIDKTDPNYNLALNAANDFGALIFPSQLISFVIACFSTTMSEIKRTRLVLFVSIIPLVINASLNYPFIYSIGLGVKGSALATLVSRCVELMVWIAVWIKIKPSFLQYYKSTLQIGLKEIFVIFPKTFLWMLNGLLVSSSFVFAIKFLSNISVQSASSLNVAGSFAQIIYAITGGFTTAVNVLIMNKASTVSGEEAKKDMYDYVKTISWLSFAMGIAAGCILMAASPLMYVLFPNISHYANTQSIFMLIAIGTMMPVNMIISVWTSSLKSGGYAKLLLVMDGLFGWAISVPVAYSLSTFATPELTYGVVYIIFTIMVLFKSPLIIYFFRRKTWIDKKLIH